MKPNYERCEVCDLRIVQRVTGWEHMNTKRGHEVKHPATPKARKTEGEGE